MVIIMLPLGELRYLPDAKAELSEERKRIKSEQKAFKNFCRRISSINATQTHKTVTASAPQTNPAALSNNISKSIERVESVYRETVMSVEHYDEDYGESFATNMAEELGSDIARATTAGHTLSPPLKQAIISATSTAQSSRCDLLRELAQEYATLSELETTLVQYTDPVASARRPLSDCSLDMLADIWQDLESHKSTCERLCRERQKQIQARKKRMQMSDEDSLCEYLHSGLAVNYPILAELLTQIQQLQVYRKRVLTQCFQVC